MSEDATLSTTPQSPPKSRRKRQKMLDDEATGPGEEWMLTYMDTVTLLVTLFVMILSFASFDKKKYEEFAQGMNLAKYGSGILMGTLGLRDQPGVGVRNVVAPKITVQTTADLPIKEPEEDADHALLEALQTQIDKQGLSEDIQLRQRQGTIEMEINERVLFPTASAELSDNGISVLVKLSELLRAHPGTIAVEGHTDSVPIETEIFPSNWELSGSRASSVARELISGGVKPEKTRIVGYAATKPVASNLTPDSRQQNRRVNIVLEWPANPSSGD
jgi:chemotaxis protein MotB